MKRKDETRNSIEEAFDKSEMHILFTVTAMAGVLANPAEKRVSMTPSEVAEYSNDVADSMMMMDERRKARVMEEEK